MLTVLAAIVTAVTALVGYWLTYRNNLRLAQRAERLDRINRQLRELYGPMLAIASVGHRIFQEYRRSIATRHERPEPLDINPEFRAWMKGVFMPNNERLYELLLTKADLLIDDKIPDCLLQLGAHIGAFKAIAQRWEENDYEVKIPPIPFPRDLLAYANDRFYRLRREQKSLMKALGQLPEELPASAIEYLDQTGG